MASLSPVFKENGTVTAGNASVSEPNFRNISSPL
jgi:acetyl-CoA acetyltransferase